MATFIDVSGLEAFSTIFVFILVVIIVYVLLSQFLGAKPVVNAILAFLVGILTMLSPSVIQAVGFITPWFALLFIFALLLGLVIKSFGGADIVSFQTAKWAVLGFALIGLIVGVLGFLREKVDFAGDSINATGDEEPDFSKTPTVIFHPLVMGAMFVFIVAAFTIALLTGSGKMH